LPIVKLLPLASFPVLPAPIIAVVERVEAFTKDGVTNRRRWVARQCGEFIATEATTKARPRTSGAAIFKALLITVNLPALLVRVEKS
jgi:hypothetical protein